MLKIANPWRSPPSPGQSDQLYDMINIIRAFYKTPVSIMLNEVNDLNSLEELDSSLRLE